MNKKDQIISSVKNASFRNMLKETSEWKSLCRGSVFNFSIIITILTSIIIYLGLNVDTILILMYDILPIFIGGMMGMIGFSLSAVVFVTSTISDRFFYTLINRNNENIDNSLKTIRRLIFPFYFSGMLNLTTVFWLSLNFILLYVICSTFVTCFIILTIPLSIYMISFSLIYNLGLIGTCIKIRFLMVEEESE